MCVCIYYALTIEILENQNWNCWTLVGFFLNKFIIIIIIIYNKISQVGLLVRIPNINLVLNDDCPWWAVTFL